MRNALLALALLVAPIANAGWFGSSGPKGEVCLFHPLEPKLISCTPAEKLEAFFKKSQSGNDVSWEKDGDGWILRVDNFDKVTKTKESLSFVFAPAYGKFGVRRLVMPGVDTGNAGVIHASFSATFDQARQGK